MSDAQQVIANVIRRHRLIDSWPSELDRLQGTRLKRECDCGWTSPERDCTWTDHPEHVAEMVDAALGGLTRQYTPWGVAHKYRTLDEVKANRLSGVNPLHEHRISSRWVTGWTPEERSATND